MKFYIPFTTDAEQTNRICNRITQRLIGMGYGPFRDLVYQVTFRRDNQLVVDTVGELCPLTGEMVMVIFSNDTGYLICSYSRGVSGGEPLLARYNVVESVVLFDK
jgi:hypothetical protein